MGFAIPSDDAMAFLNEAKVTYATLDATPAAAAAQAPATAGAPPGTPAAPGAPAPLAPPAPPPPVAPAGFMQPWMWLVAAALVAFLVALITSLAVAKSVARMAATPAVAYAPHADTGVGRWAAACRPTACRCPSTRPSIQQRT